ncbi:MAG: S8 family peptidase [Sphingomonadales bacterium]
MANRTGNGLILVSLALFLAGCGGSNTPLRTPLATTQPPPPPPAATPPPPPPPSADADVFRTPEFNTHWGLEAIGAAEAYAAGFTGQGVVIGFMDFNFEFDSPEINYHPLSLGLDPAMVAIYEAQIGEPAITDRHGQAVAVVAAGIKNNSETHGVAFNAQILAVDFFSGVNTNLINQGGTLFHVSDPWTYLVNNGARVVNKSIGFDEGDIISNPPQVGEKYIVDFDALVVAAGGLLVSSAGNNSDPDPSLSNLETIRILRENNLLNFGPGALIIVGAVDENLQMASFSDKAGVAMEHFMVAPGVGIVFPWNGQLVIGDGTSLSAPIVTGAAAILFQRWPTLTAREVRDILFASATDLGAPGLDPIFGHGMLNLNAALQPLGQTTLAVQGTTTVSLVQSAAITLGSAFGDAGGFTAGLTSVMMLDGFQRDFQIDLSGFVNTGRTRALLADIISERRNWRSSSLALGSNGYLGFAVGQDPMEANRLALLGRAAQDLGPERDLILQFTGTIAGFDLVAGTGSRLADVLGDAPFRPGGAAPLSLSRAFRGGFETSAGSFAVAGLWLGEATRLRFGTAFANARGNRFHPVEDLRKKNRVTTSTLRVDYYGPTLRLGAEGGLLIEEGAILGSRSAGGLSLTDRSRTLWLSLDGGKALGGRFYTALKMSAAVTEPGSPGNSLFSSLGAIASSSFSFRFGGQHMFRQGDDLSFTVHQPLRVERANLKLNSGIGRDLETGDIIFGRSELSLTPSGREIGLEAAYRLALGDWIAEANLAFRFAADHVAGRRDAAVLLGLSRRF